MHKGETSNLHRRALCKTAFTMARAFVQSMLLMLVALDQSSSVVVQRYCISLLLCGEFLLGMLACRLGLSSKSSPTIGSFPPTDK